MLALHGGGEYVGGDEAAMDALLDAALSAAGRVTPRIVIVPTAAARQRPELAVGHGRIAFEAAAVRRGRAVEVSAAMLLGRSSAEQPAGELLERLESAHLVHLPGGDPDLIPMVLRGTPAWAAILRALSAGACLAGASAGAMAMTDRLWSRAGPIDGLGLLPGYALLPHYAIERLPAWRRVVDGARPLGWIGIVEQTVLIGRPEGAWRVAGRGSVHVFAAGVEAQVAEARSGQAIQLP